MVIRRARRASPAVRRCFAADGTDELHQVDVAELLEISLVAFPAYGDGTSAEARSARAIERITGVRPRVSTDAYSGREAGKHSFFLDMLAAQSDQPRTVFAGPRTAFDDINPEHARNRLASIEHRAGVNTALTSGGEMVGGSSLPADIANAYAIGSRTASVVEPLFEALPLTSAQLSGSQSGRRT